MRKLILVLIVFALFLTIAPALAQDGEEAGLAGNGYVRFIHLSPDLGEVDLTVNGVSRSSIQELGFGAVTGWILVPEGTVEVIAQPSGRGATLFGGPQELEIGADERLAIVAYGQTFGEGVNLTVVPLNTEEIPEDTARVTVFHAIEGAPEVNIVAGGNLVEPLVYRLGYPSDANDGLFELEVPAGTYDLAVVPFNTSTVFLDLPGTTFEAGVDYFVAAAGTLEEPTVVVAVTD